MYRLMEVNVKQPNGDQWRVTRRVYRSPTCGHLAEHTTGSEIRAANRNHPLHQAI